MLQIPSLSDLNMGLTIPALSVAVWACILLIVDLWVPKERKEITAWLAAGGLVFAFVANLVIYNRPGTAFMGLFVADQFSGFLNIIILLSAFFGVLLSIDYLKRTGMERGEYYVLLLLTTSGMMFMAGANDLTIVFISLELLSIPLYILSAFRLNDLKSEEAGIKYFILGAFSSAFFIFGAALLYGATGTTHLPGIYEAVGRALAGQGSSVVLLLLGVGLTLVGLGFKVAVVPFHTWTPDVYEGAPTPITAFMSVGAKAGGFAALLRILLIGLPGFIFAGQAAATWQTVMWIIAALTLLLGNIVAISQSNIKRMLAYSSIAHAGYIMIAVAAAGSPGVSTQAAQAALIYLLAYMFTNIGAFAVAIAIEKNDGTGTSLDDFIGLSKTRPILALIMAVFMLSLTGIPLTSGFIGKWVVFQAALNAHLEVVAVIGVLTSVVSAFYYVRVIVNMYLRDDRPGDEASSASPIVTWAIYLAFAGTVVMGIIPWVVTNLSDRISMISTIIH